MGTLSGAPDGRASGDAHKAEGRHAYVEGQPREHMQPSASRLHAAGALPVSVGSLVQFHGIKWRALWELFSLAAFSRPSF